MPLQFRFNPGFHPGIKAGVRMLATVLALVIFTAYGATAVSATSKRALIVTSIDSVFKPASDSLAASASNVLQALDGKCHSQTANRAFRGLVRAFSETEFYLIGAINQDNRAERLFFWPDQKSRGRKQLLRMLDNPDRSTIDAVALAKKSVALQGLPALEQILHGRPSTSPDEDCAYARAIAANIKIMAEDIQTDWHSEEGVVKALLESNPELVYHDEDEAIGAIVTQAVKSIHSINGLKVARIIEGLELNGEIPKSMPFWISGLTLQNLDGNVVALRRIVLDNGLGAYAGIENKLRTEFERASRLVDGAIKALQVEDTPTTIDQLKQLRQLLIDINIELSVTIAPKLGVIPGFNGRDGD